MAQPDKPEGELQDLIQAMEEEQREGSDEENGEEGEDAMEASISQEEIEAKIRLIEKFQAELLSIKRGPLSAQKRTELYKMRNEIADYVADVKRVDLKKIVKMNPGAGRVASIINKDQRQRRERNERFLQYQNMRVATKARLTASKANNLLRLEALLDSPTEGRRIKQRENEIVSFSLAAAICRHVKEDLPSFRYGDASGMVNAALFGARYTGNRQEVILSKLGLAMPN